MNHKIFLLQRYVADSRWDQLVRLYGNITCHKRILTGDEVSALTTALLREKVVYKGFRTITDLLLSHPGTFQILFLKYLSSAALRTVAICSTHPEIALSAFQTLEQRLTVRKREHCEKSIDVCHQRYVLLLFKIHYL